MAKLLNELARDYLARKLGDPIFYLCLHIVTNQLDMTVARQKRHNKNIRVVDVYLKNEKK